VQPALLDKTIVVIGGTSGIGRSAVRAFHQAGANLVIVGLDTRSCEETEAELSGSAAVLTGDACDPNTAVKAIAAAVEKNGQLDALYHVAGGSGRRFGDGPLHELTDEGWARTIELNLTSVLYSNRAAIRQFLAQDTGGAILNLASVLAFAPSPAHFATHAYATAKAGIIALSQSAAAHYAPNNIRINVLAPGLVDTPMAQRAANDPMIRQFIKTKQPLDGGRIGAPSDLDGAAVFLLSEAARFCTGQVLAVDGGWSRSEGQTGGA
jgi:NAD(P)-dependent dehydrogenase (short-subunit alcohol dehydrogenase family)